MIELLKALYDCGAISFEDAEALGIPTSDIQELVTREQVISKVVDGKELFKLNDFGEKIYRMETGKKQFFRCENWEKMKSLADFYAKLSKEERDSWKSKDEWYYEGCVGAIPDATYQKGEEICGVFVQSNFTTRETINSVEKFVQDRGISNFAYLR